MVNRWAAQSTLLATGTPLVPGCISLCRSLGQHQCHGEGRPANMGNSWPSCLDCPGLYLEESTSVCRSIVPGDQKMPTTTSSVHSVSRAAWPGWWQVSAVCGLDGGRSVLYVAWMVAGLCCTWIFGSLAESLRWPAVAYSQEVSVHSRSAAGFTGKTGPWCSILASKLEWYYSFFITLMCE